MALLKVISAKWSLGSSDSKGCLSWCFGTGEDASKNDRSDYEDFSEERKAQEEFEEEVYGRIPKGVAVAKEASENSSIASSAAAASTKSKNKRSSSKSSNEALPGRQNGRVHANCFHYYVGERIVLCIHFLERSIFRVTRL